MEIGLGADVATGPGCACLQTGTVRGPRSRAWRGAAPEAAPSSYQRHRGKVVPLTMRSGGIAYACGRIVRTLSRGIDRAGNAICDKSVWDVNMIDETTVELEWNKNAPQWIAQVRQGLDILRETLNNPAFFDHFVPDLSGMEVIDLGCGEGRNTRLLAGRGARMTGIDIASKMIEAAQCAEEESPLDIQYRVCSYTSLNGFADASFDAAISTMALMESPHFDRTAREVFRILRPGGTLYFSVLHPCFWTRGSRWVTDGQGADQGMLVTDYWIDEPYMEIGRFAFVPEDLGAIPFSIPRFPYQLETYVNGLSRAGLRVTRVLEPRPAAADVVRHPTLLGPIFGHAPISMFFSAVKCARWNDQS